MSPGLDPTESTQSLNFIVTATTPACSAQADDRPNGNLSFTPAPDVSGMATVSVQIHDDGGTANGGVDTSGVQTFRITVTFVNQAPSFTKGTTRQSSKIPGRLPCPVGPAR